MSAAKRTLGITLAELVAGLEGGISAAPKYLDFKTASVAELRALEVQRLARRLGNQQAAVQKTVKELLGTLIEGGSAVDVPKSRRTKAKKK